MHAQRKPERLHAAPRPLTACAALLSLPAAALVVGCGSSPSHGSSAGSCAASSPGADFARARLVFAGTMLPGRTTDLGGHRFLLSPAQVRVTRYLKGHGPGVVTVATGVTSGNLVSADGILPLAGQRWTIYATSRRMPYQTSICDGSKPASKAPGT